MIYDAIIVGAGPAGCMAAYELAKAGKIVLLLEKEKLPRYKACGGGIPKIGLEQLDFDYGSAVDNWVDKVRYSYECKQPIEIKLAKPIVAMVMRDKFDYLLAQRAVAAGADLLERVNVTEIISSGKIVRAGNGKHSWEARYLIGADGALSSVAKKSGLRKPGHLAVALEVELPYRIKWNKALAEFGFGIIDGGYAWAFPKNEFLSVGIGAPYNKQKLMHERLTKWLDYLGYDYIDERIHGHPLPFFEKEIKLVDKNILLAGDAAHLMDPLSGEGIQHALVSGKLAARAIIKNDLKLYQKEVKQKISNNLKISARLAKFFYTFPKFSYEQAVKNPRSTELFAKLLAGEISYQEIWEKAKKRMFRVFPS
jgi:geranylgeranyl reductase family protein